MVNHQRLMEDTFGASIIIMRIQDPKNVQSETPRAAFIFPPGSRSGSRRENLSTKKRRKMQGNC